MILDKKLLHTTDAYIKKLNLAGLNTSEDLINHYPRTYENKSNVLEFFSYVNLKEKNTIICEIETIGSERTRNNKQLIKAIIKDKNGFLAEAVWFNQLFLLRDFKQGNNVIIFGKPKYNYGKLSFLSPDIEHAGKDNKTISPIYPELNYIPSDWFEKKIEIMKPYFKEIKNVLPDEIIRKKGFSQKHENLYKIHFPKDEADFEKARKELAYEELYVMQLKGLLKKKHLEENSLGKSPKIDFDAELVKDIISHIPYSLTNSQKIVIFQILKDMEKLHSMRRLLQGDVGTGKTIVALITAIHAIIKGDIQVALMVPTEILARQHFESIADLLFKYDIRSDLLVGSLTEKQKTEAKARMKNGETQLIVGTHALIQEGVKFKKLGYVIIDEQHRFGVEQRKFLEEYYSQESKEIGVFPHNLNMTATPIPRTLALTIYGDQDISVLSEYPAGRLPIHTRVIRDEDREKMYMFIEEEIKAGRQIYWISPLVTESETLDIANATQMQEFLQNIFPGIRVGLLHGKMKPKEKDRIMEEFMNNEIKILSSTSVVEVGVNNRNATVMCIEASERFGLSQLHQFRGRVGRAEHQSYCYLFTTKEYKEKRLKAMEDTNDGFELSEIDLELRGPGEVYGIRQSGIEEFRIANLSDFELISEIREDIETNLGLK
ncbi:MAG: ATP-dependent DNA helicase RecG [Candidatus Gracilibacteria bacterium]|nr:ATP-dependent DNA helicase RecG [Candidatus Gracilibacteria bacterium]